MNNQLTYNQSKEYDSLKTLGVFIGFVCGAPVYKKFSMEQVRPVSFPLMLYPSLAL